MGATCVTPTYTEVEATYGVFDTEPPPCIPDAVTELIELLTESLADILTEANDQIFLAEES